MVKLISQNLIKKTLPLLTKKGRDKSSLFIVEGKKYVSEIPDNWSIEFYVVSDSLAHSDLSVYENKACVYIAKDYQFKKLSDTVTPQGVMAICNKQPRNVEDMLNGTSLIMLCEALSDPGNVGTLIRAANAASATGVILTQGCADLYNPKVIRAAASSIFHIPCIEVVDALEIAKLLKNHHICLAGAHLNGSATPYSVNMTNPICIMIGNEAHGLTPEMSAQADILIKIPMKANSESLNAASAGSILLYEAVRQRLFTN